MLETFRSNFHCQITEVEGDEDGAKLADGSPCVRYSVELLASGLFQAEDSGTAKWETVGFAIVSFTDNRLTRSRKRLRSVIIEQLDVETGNALTDIEAFAAIIHRLQHLCLEHNIEHLAMLPLEGFWSSGLLKQAGFSLCDCNLPSKHDNDDFRLCMFLSAAENAPQKDSYIETRHVSNKADVATTAKGKLLAANSADIEGSSPKKQLEIHHFSNKSDVATAATDQLPAADSADTESSSPKKDPKKYCMHYLSRGSCAYVQTGCKYSHDMPIDKGERERIGIQNIPRWFEQSGHWGRFLDEVRRVDPSQYATLTGHRHPQLGNHLGQAGTSRAGPGSDVMYIGRVTDGGPQAKKQGKGRRRHKRSGNGGY